MVNKSEVSLGYMVRPCHKKKKEEKILFTPFPASLQIGILSGRVGGATDNKSFFPVLCIIATIKTRTDSDIQTQGIMAQTCSGIIYRLSNGPKG